MRNPLAGKKAKILYRNPDKSTVLEVEDEHDEILVTVEEDGTMFEERWAGVAGVRRLWQAAAPHFGAMRVPDDAGRKRWTHLEPEAAPAPEPAPEPGPEPAPNHAPERDRLPPSSVDVMRADAALQLARTVWGWGEARRSVTYAGINPEVAARWIGVAVDRGWVTVDGDLIRKGPVNPNPPGRGVSRGVRDIDLLLYKSAELAGLIKQRQHVEVASDGPITYELVGCDMGEVARGWVEAAEVSVSAFEPVEGSVPDPVPVEPLSEVPLEHMGKAAREAAARQAVDGDAAREPVFK